MTHDEQWDEIEAGLQAKYERAGEAIWAAAGDSVFEYEDKLALDPSHPDYTADVHDLVIIHGACNVARIAAIKARKAGEDPILWKLANG